jgi:hypothetical protein
MLAHIINERLFTGLVGSSILVFLINELKSVFRPWNRGGIGQNFCVRPDDFWSRIGENSAKTSEYTNSGKEQPSLMIDRHSNKESKWRLIAAIVTVRSELCLYTNLYKYLLRVCFFYFEFIPKFTWPWRTGENSDLFQLWYGIVQSTKRLQSVNIFLIISWVLSNSKLASVNIFMTDVCLFQLLIISLLYLSIEMIYQIIKR